MRTMQDFRLFRVTYEDGTSFVSNMRATLTEASNYFLGHRLEQSDETTKLVVKVEEISS